MDHNRSLENKTKNKTEEPNPFHILTFSWEGRDRAYCNSEIRPVRSIITLGQDSAKSYPIYNKSSIVQANCPYRQDQFLIRVCALAKFVFECLRKIGKELALLIQFSFVSTFQGIFILSIYGILLAVLVTLHTWEADSLPIDFAYPNRQNRLLKFLLKNCCKR